MTRHSRSWLEQPQHPPAVGDGSIALANVNRLAGSGRLFSEASAECLVLGTRAIAAMAQRCRDVGELRRVIPTADYLKALLSQSSASLSQLNEAAALRLRTMRQIGVRLEQMNLRGGDRRSKSHAATLKLEDLGLTKHFASRCRKIASLEERIFEAAIDRGLKSQHELTAALIYRLARPTNPTVKVGGSRNVPQEETGRSQHVAAGQCAEAHVAHVAAPGFQLVRTEDLEEIQGNVDILSRLLTGRVVNWLEMEVAAGIENAGVKQIPRYLGQIQSALDNIKRTAQTRV